MKTIEDQNKLIAEFMGEKFTDGSGVVQGLNYKLIEKKHGKGNNGFRFHTSWDWLMPVVIIIEEQNELIGAHILSTNIDATYKAVVKFIKEYNETK